MYSYNTILIRVYTVRESHEKSVLFTQVRGSRGNSGKVRESQGSLQWSGDIAFSCCRLGEYVNS